MGRGARIRPLLTLAEEMKRIIPFSSVTRQSCCRIFYTSMTRAERMTSKAIGQRQSDSNFASPLTAFLVIFLTVIANPQGAHAQSATLTATVSTSRTRSSSRSVTATRSKSTSSYLAIEASVEPLPTSGVGMSTPLVGAYYALAPCNMTVTITGGGGGGGYGSGKGGGGATFQVTLAMPAGLIFNSTPATGGTSGNSSVGGGAGGGASGIFTSTFVIAVAGGGGGGSYQANGAYKRK